MELIKRVSAAVAAFKSFNINRLPTGSGGSTLDFAWAPGTNINWDAVTGDVLTCPAAQACFNFQNRNLPQARPVLMEQDRKGTWNPVQGHAINALMKRPNPKYNGKMLRNQIAFSMDVNGNAYIVAERTRAGEVAELYWWPHHWVSPPPGSNDEITYWVLRDKMGRYIEVPAEDVMHLKCGLDPDDPRFGMSPLASISRDIYTLQQAVTYGATILRNFGTIGKTVSPRDSAVRIGDPKALKAHLDAQSRGDNAASTVVLSEAVNIDYPGVTPQNMALDTIEDRPEHNVCAMFGFKIEAVGLYGGRNSKTYANASDAREQSWEEGLMPKGDMIVEQMGDWLIPQFESSPAVVDRMELQMDYSKVRSLQPDLDKLAVRWVKIWEKNGCTLEQFCAGVGIEKPEPALAKMRYVDFAGSGKPDPVSDPNADPAPAGDNAKGFKIWTDRIDEEIEAMERLVAA